MGRKSKRTREMAGKLDLERSYSLEEAIETLKGCPQVKFDQTVELSLVLGIDPRKSDQQVRGTVSLPSGTGKSTRVVVVAKGDKADEASEAGADHAGADEIVDRIKQGWLDFDVLVTTPDMMREVGKLGKVLGPRGLMPTPKAGTVTTNIKDAVTEFKAGKVEYKADKAGVIQNAVGKLSAFTTEQLVENIRTVLNAVERARPPSVKGSGYIKRMWVSSTMGPGLKVETREYAAN